jgi:hypothetical protein
MLIAQLYLHQLHLLVGVAVVDVGDGVPAPLSPHSLGCAVWCDLVVPISATWPWIHLVCSLEGVIGGYVQSSSSNTSLLLLSCPPSLKILVKKNNVLNISLGCII